MVDVAIIGAGLMGRWHLITAQRLGARVLAIIDPDRAAAASLGRRAPTARLGDSLTALLDLPLDAAHVCSPSADHVGTAVSLAERGIHCLVEKPLAETLEHTRMVLEAASRHQIQICPVHQYAFQPGVERALKFLPRLGAMRRIDFNICSAGAERGDCSPDDLVRDILPHPISILQRILPSCTVASLDWKVLSPAPGELQAMVLYGQLLVTVYISSHARPTRMKTEIECNSGSIEIDGFHGYCVVRSGRVSRTSKITGPFERSLATLGAATANLAGRALRRETAYAGLSSLMKRFYVSILDNPTAPAPILPATALDAAGARDILIERMHRAPRSLA